MWTMNHPSAPLRDGDTANRLSRDFRDRQRGQLLRLSVRSRAGRARSAFLGFAVGVATVFALCAVEKQPLHWYTPAWEAILLGFAGYLLARTHGGFLNGTGLFGLAYMATIFMRELGFDSTEVLARAAEARTMSLHGDFAALLSVGVIGGLIGFLSDRR